MTDYDTDDLRLGRHEDGWMGRNGYTRLWGELLAASEGDRFAVRFFCPQAKTSSADTDAYVVREGVIDQVHTGGIDFEDGEGHADAGEADYNSRATVVFETDRGRYKASFSVQSTPSVSRYQKTGKRSRDWVRQSKAVTGAMVKPQGGCDD